MRRHALLITGATGHVGGETLRLLLESAPDLRAFVLIRDRSRWLDTVVRLRLPVERVTPVLGDLTRPGLALGRSVRADLAREVSVVVHAAADTTVSRPLELSRAINRDGTAHLVELAATWGGLERFVHVSTAFVAGRLTGDVAERAHGDEAGFVNAYEQSKHEAECVVRAAGVPFVIARPSTIVCESERGEVRQLNAVHRALGLYEAGLASLLPGAEDTPVDLVTNAYVSRGVAALAIAPDAQGRTVHLCAGSAALQLGQLLDAAYATWSESEAWRRRGIVRPALTDLETYRLFERTVEETGDSRLRRVSRSLSHFVPQLALPKRFDTRGADELLGFRATPWSAWLRRMLVSIARDAPGDRGVAGSEAA